MKSNLPDTGADDPTSTTESGNGSDGLARSPNTTTHSTVGDLVRKAAVLAVSVPVFAVWAAVGGVVAVLNPEEPDDD